MENYNDTKNFCNKILGCVNQIVKDATEIFDDSKTLKEALQQEKFCKVKEPTDTIIWDNIGKILNEYSPNIVWPVFTKSFKTSEESIFEFLMEGNTSIIKEIDHDIDVVYGKKSSETIKNVETDNVNMIEPKDILNLNKNLNQVITLTEINKPQLNFKNWLKNDNLSYCPNFENKSNNKVPVGFSLDDFRKICSDEEYLCLLGRHPYVFEIFKFQYPMCELKKKNLKNCTLPKKITSTELNYIDTLYDLKTFIRYINEENIKEIAVDLENHYIHSFLGFLCLMQISTRNVDFIIDVIVLHDEIHILNEIFTDPSILKVFHGGYHDITWLQRDFNIFVVNYFDTYLAAKQFQMEKYSLASLLLKYCKVYADKSLQLADWRTRPLSNRMINYARSDTHYLLYIYDMLVCELLNTDQYKGEVLELVLEQCKKLTLKMYIKPVFNHNDYLLILKKYKRCLNFSQESGLKELYKWRLETAKELDESEEYVLPQHMLFSLSEKLPKDVEGIYACCNPIPEIVRKNTSVLLKIISKILKKAGLATFYSEKNSNENNKSNETLKILHYSENDRNNELQEENYKVNLTEGFKKQYFIPGTIKLSRKRTKSSSNVSNGLYQRYLLAINKMDKNNCVKQINKNWMKLAQNEDIFK